MAKTGLLKKLNLPELILAVQEKIIFGGKKFLEIFNEAPNPPKFLLLLYMSAK